MGNNTSKSSQSVTNDIVISAVNRAYTNISQKVNVNNFSWQSMVVTFEKVVGCNISTIQVQDRNLMAVATMSGTIQTSFSNDISTDIITQMQNQANQTMSGMPLFQFNKSVSDQSFKTNLTTTVENAIESSHTAHFSVDQKDTQVLRLTFKDITCYPGQKIEATQYGLSKVMAQVTINSIVTAISGNKVISTAAQTLDNAVKQKAENNIFGIIGGVVGIVVFIIICIVIYNLVKGKKNDDDDDG